jgi:mono/diheme cytochrome c family protein
MADQVALGNRIFHGEASYGTCSGCHGSDAGGSTVGPALNSGHWLWSDGSLAGLTAAIENGVAQPKQYQGVMPPLGEAPPFAAGRGGGCGICLGRRPCQEA